MPSILRPQKGLPAASPPVITPDWIEFLDATPAMIWLSDTVGNVLHVNAAWTGATGLSLPQLTPNRLLELVHPEDRARLGLEAVTFAGQPDATEFRLRHADGTYRWVSERIRPWHRKGNKLCGYIGSSIDINAQKIHEHRLSAIALRQTSLTHFSRIALVQPDPREIACEGLRILCEHLALPAAVLIHGPEDVPVVLAATGIDPSTLTLRPFAAAPLTELAYPTDLENFPIDARALAAQGWESGLAIPLEPSTPKLGILIGLRRGPALSAASGVAPLHFARDLAGLLAIALERWRAQRQLREGEERALSAQKMEAVGLLAGGVAHDFNNLLTAIRCFADLLRDELTDPPQIAKIDDILHASSRASHLVRQLLSFSRHEVVQLEDLDLNTILDDLRGFIRSLLSEHVRIEVHLADRAAWCRADRKQLEQILFNLCLNARDVMPAEGVLRLSISLFTTSAGPCVRLSVGDSGPGIPPEVAAQLFQPFYTTKARGRGTGLGLTTCRRIAQSFDGNLTFETTLGRGTVFHLDLPEIADPLLAYLAPEAEVSPIVRSARARILLVEDDELVRSVARLMAESLGHHVREFGDSVEACEYAALSSLQEVDVLITDIVMPRLNGHELARRLLAIKPSLRVCYMSGYVDDALTQKAMAEPGVCFLSKPFSSDEFATRLAGLLA